jgi:hypothetical protein
MEKFINNKWIRVLTFDYLDGVKHANSQPRPH